MENSKETPKWNQEEFLFSLVGGESRVNECGNGGLIKDQDVGGDKNDVFFWLANAFIVP